MTGVLRHIETVTLPDVVPRPAKGSRPIVIEVRPADLLVDESYQRGLSRRSLKLVARMVEQWDWSAYKPPTLVRVGGDLHVIDGQHTAIAAATRGDIDLLPAFLVEAAEVADRARAFVGINHDRVAVTPLQLHHALALSGDEDALTINQVCARAGAVVLRGPPINGSYVVGDIVCIDAIRRLIMRRHALGARRVLEVTVKAKLAPISRSSILAVDALLFDKKYAGLDEQDVITWLRDPRMRTRAEQHAAEAEIPIWRSLAVCIASRIGGSNGRASAA